MNFPVAVNCLERPATTDGLVGVTTIETSIAGVTVSEALPLTLPFAALTVTGPPAFRPVATPEELIMATVESDEVQVTWVVITCVDLSEKCPIALNDWVLPAAMLVGAGDTVIVSRVGGFTVSEPVPLTLSIVAVMVIGPPALRPVARPEELTEAIVGSDELQVTWVVTS